MKPFLYGQGLFGYLDGSIPCPPVEITIDVSHPPLSNLAYAAWIQQDQLIVSTLISSLH